MLHKLHFMGVLWKCVFISKEVYYLSLTLQKHFNAFLLFQWGMGTSLRSGAGPAERFPGSCHSPLSPLLDLATPPFYELPAVTPTSTCASLDMKFPICAFASCAGEDCLLHLARGTRLNQLTSLIPRFLIISCNYASLRAAIQETNFPLKNFCQELPRSRARDLRRRR